MIRVLVADDQALVRAGFEVLVDSADDLSVVGTAGDGARAVELARATRPDVVLMDIRMPVMDGVEATAAITADTGLPPGVDLSVFRIVQEALTNVLRHGGPTATVAVRCGRGAVEVEVTDPGGRGTAAPSSGSGHGLLGMRERVAVFGGTLDAGPGPGRGWHLTATLPFDPAEVGEPV